MARNFYYDRKKKSSNRLSGGYAINYDRKKKDTGGKFSLRPEKKKFQSSVWRVRDQLRPEKKKIQAGNFHYDRKKKSSSRLSGGCVSFWFWREIGSFFVAAEKKFVLVQLELKLIQIR